MRSPKCIDKKAFFGVFLIGAGRASSPRLFAASGAAKSCAKNQPIVASAAVIELQPDLHRSVIEAKPKDVFLTVSA